MPCPALCCASHSRRPEPAAAVPSPTPPSPLVVDQLPVPSTLPPRLLPGIPSRFSLSLEPLPSQSPAMRFGMLALFALGSALGVVAQDGINFVEPQGGFGGSVRPIPCPELRLALYGVERHASELLRGLCFAGGPRCRAMAD